MKEILTAQEDMLLILISYPEGSIEVNSSRFVVRPLEYFKALTVSLVYYRATKEA